MTNGVLRRLAVSLFFLILLPTTGLAFSDVSSSHPFYDAIQDLSQKKVINGYPDGLFRPDQAVHRDEFITMVFRHIGYKPKAEPAATSFLDVPPESWFGPYVKKALELGALNINPQIPRFYPDQPITKIEAFKILMPLEGIPVPFINDQTEIIFNDVQENASYSYLVRAAQRSGLFLENKENYFYPFKNLTRGELAQLLYQAQIYRENQVIMDGVFDKGFFSSDLTEEEKSLINSPKFPLLVHVWNEINLEYYKPEDVNQDKLIYGAANGMVQTLKDPYSVFFDPEKAAQLESSLQGEFEGIGIMIDVVDGKPVIAQVIPDSPAAKADLKPGDLLITIDGKEIADLSLEGVMNALQGKAGTEVQLTIKRAENLLTFAIIREVIQMDSVSQPSSTVQIPPDIGYIVIYLFADQTDEEFSAVLKQVLAKDPKGLIVDLRNNGGGYLDSALHLLNHFIEKDKILVNMKLNGKILQEKSEGSGVIDIPVVVLINNNTASAAEIVAAALQDHKVAKLIGEQSYGKGVAQKVITYSDGSILKLTFEKWLTPLQRDINEVGLKPDIEVTRTKADIASGKDPQLERAINELLK